MRSSTLAFLLLVIASAPVCSAFSSISAGKLKPKVHVLFPSAESSLCRIQNGRPKAHNDCSKLKATPTTTTETTVHTGKSFRSKLAGFALRIVLFPLDLLGMFVAAVLSRAINQPSVRNALGACIVSGVKQLCSDPDLDKYVDQATTTINEDMEDDAREMAVALPRLARAFFQGLTQADTLQVEVKESRHSGK